MVEAAEVAGVMKVAEEALDALNNDRQSTHSRFGMGHRHIFDIDVPKILLQILISMSNITSHTIY